MLLKKKKSELARGLEGVVAAQSSLSLVDGEKGQLYYRGIPIGELTEHSHYEEVVYLLWYGKLPTATELEEFDVKLKSKRVFSDKIIPIFKAFPTTAHPMSILRTMASVSGLFDGRSQIINPEESQRKAYRLTAVFPTIIAGYCRIREGKDPIPPDLSLSHAANFLHMLTGEVPEKEMVKALDAYLILLADHGLNASTFAARVTTGTRSNLYSAVTSAVGTLMGDLHGSANQRAMEMLLDIASPEKAEDYVIHLLNQKKKVMGFGHRIYKGKDPRAEAFRNIARQLCEKADAMKWMEIADKVEKVMREKKRLCCNVDFFSAPVLYILGFPVDFFTTVFAASRVAGWSAHIVEQQRDNRLIRPRAEYIGLRDQHYIPMEDRV